MCGNPYNSSYEHFVRTESNESKETGYGSEEISYESEYETEYEYDNEISRIKRSRMNTNNFDVFSHAFFNEYEIGSYDNDLPSDSSSTSSESEIAYRIKPQGKVKIC